MSWKRSHTAPALRNHLQENIRIRAQQILWVGGCLACRSSSRKSGLGCSTYFVSTRSERNPANKQKLATMGTGSGKHQDGFRHSWCFLPCPSQGMCKWKAIENRACALTPRCACLSPHTAQSSFLVPNQSSTSFIGMSHDRETDTCAFFFKSHQTLRPLQKWHTHARPSPLDSAGRPGATPVSCPEHSKPRAPGGSPQAAAIQRTLQGVPCKG